MDGLSRTKHWAWGAVIAVLCSFAHAKTPGVPHGGGSWHASGHAYGAPARPARNDTAERNARPPRNVVNFANGNYANGLGSYSPGMHRVAGPAGYGGDGRGGVQYAGAITPVSAESRSVPRPPPNAPVRTGSIRADVARYNEERGSGRAMQRQVDDPRPPEGNPYRN